MTKKELMTVAQVEQLVTELRPVRFRNCVRRGRAGMGPLAM